MNAITELDEYTLYWLAGLLEGEASFSYGGPSRPNTPRIVLLMANEEVVARVAKIFGNSYTYVAPRKAHWSPTYVTSIHGERAAMLMEKIYPLMGQRRHQQIKCALENYVPTSQRTRNRFRVGAKLNIEQV